MADDQDKQDYQDYLDYQEYLKRVQTPQYIPADDPTSNPEALEATGAHALNSFLFGHGPNVYGAIKHPADAIKALISPETQTAQNNQYIPERDKAAAFLQKTTADYPAASLGGKAVGMVGSALIPGAVMAPAASAAGRIAQGAALGAGYGALQNPGDTPGQAQGVQAGARGVNAALGGAIGGVGATAGELLADLGAKTAGFNSSQKEAYRSNPSEVKAIANSTDLANQAKAEDLLNTSSDALKNMNVGPGGMDEQLNSRLSGKFIPESAVGAAQSKLAELGERPMTVDLGTGNVEANEVRRGMQILGDQQYIKNPITGVIEGKDPGISAAYANARKSLSDFIPEAGSDLDAMHSVIEAQQGLKGGNARPIGFLKSAAPDTAAARQAADQIVNGGLEDAANEFSAGYKMKEHNGPLPFLGRKAITASKAARPAALTLEQLIGAARQQQ